MAENQPESRPRRRSRACGCVAAAGILLLLLVLVPLTLWYAWVTASARKVEAALATLREAGEPTTVEELNAIYVLPEGTRDVAALWLAATGPLDEPEFHEAAKGVPILDRELPENEREIPPPGEPWPRREAAETLLEKYAESLRLMHEAAGAGGRARYPLVSTNRKLALTPNRHPIRQGDRLLELEAHVRAHRGDWPGAAESIETIQRLAGSLEYEPLLVSQLTHISTNSIGYRVLHSLLPYGGWTDEELARLQAVLDKTDFDFPMRRAMQGERVWGIEMLRDPEMVGQARSRSLVLGWIDPGYDDLLFYLNMMERGTAIVRSPSPASLDAAEQFDADLEAFFSRGGLVSMRYPISRIIRPAFASVCQSVVRGNAVVRMAAAAIACERFRHRHGRLPESLKELVPEFLADVPIDPFDGQPLRYIAEEDGFKVYSIGPNRIDDGGHHDEVGYPMQGDFVFPVRRKRTE